MDKVLELSRPILIFLFVILACAILPGILALKLFLPDLILEGRDGLLLSGLLASSVVIMPAFLLLSVTGTGKGEAANNQRFMTEFTFASFTCFISYFAALSVCYFKQLTFGWFVGIAVPIWALSLWFFMAVRP